MVIVGGGIVQGCGGGDGPFYPSKKRVVTSLSMKDHVGIIWEGEGEHVGHGVWVSRGMMTEERNMV